jgi:CRISPR system Cascade subunit CasB
MLIGLYRISVTHNKYRPVEAIGILAALLAKVDSSAFSESTDSFAAQLGKSKDSTTRPAMSELRFQNMQKAADWDELFIRLRRAVDLLGGKVNILSLANTVFLWGEKLAGNTDHSKVRELPFEMARDYYTEVLNLE